MIATQVIDTISSVLFLVAAIGFVFIVTKFYLLAKNIDKMTDDHFYQIRKKTVQLDELIKSYEDMDFKEMSERIKKKRELNGKATKHEIDL